MTTRRNACQEAATGCRRCTLYADECAAPQTALMLACQNEDAQLTLIRALSAGKLKFPYELAGLLVNIPQARAHASDLFVFLQDNLNFAAQAAIKGVFVREDASLEDVAQAVCFRAEALPQFIARFEHEWVRRALTEDWLFSMFQPIVDAYTGEAFAYEALIRARNPQTQQIIGAGSLIEACNRLQLHHQLDQRARQCAIRGAATLQLPNALFFINFNPNTIYDPEICLRTTMEAAQSVDMPLSRLVFEVVESEDIPDMKRLRHILDYYRSKGVGTAVDDLGAGFASLDYLEQLHPNYAKIDRQIVVQAAISSEARRQLDQIISTAKSLGIQTIAEGIETELQLTTCRHAGVDYVQGYLLARPAYPPAPVCLEHFRVRSYDLQSVSQYSYDAVPNSASY